MDSNRYAIIEWISNGYITPDNADEALNLSGVKPPEKDWIVFIDRILLAFGALMLSAGVIFFFAYNWNDLTRFQKFGIIDGLIILSLLAIWFLGLEKREGKIALFVSSVFVGVLLALIGQTYQTGADPFQLFGVWAVLILPWAVIGRLTAIWVLWWALVNTSVSLYYKTFGGLLGFFFGPDVMLWVLFIFNTIALIVWVGCYHLGITKLQSLWATRLLITASGGLAVSLALMAIFGSDSGLGFLAWLGWIGAAYYFYRVRSVDIYVLSGGVLSVVIVFASLLGSLINDAGGFFVIGFFVIGISALGGKWLKDIIKEEAQ